MSDYCAELMLKEPLTKKDWEMIADADFKYTSKVTFTTPHCGEVEFVKVVRCKDCKHYREGKVLSPNKFCFRLKDRDGEEIGYNFAEDDFCSYGERREDEQTD